MNRFDLQLAVHATLVPPQGAVLLEIASVGPSNKVIALWRGEGRHVVSLDAEGLHAVPLRLTPCRYPMIQPLPGGRILISDSRAEIDRDSAAPVAPSTWIFSPSGVAIASGSLGDGIEHMLTTPSGDIWVGYFDEGIYGGGAVEHHGLVRFSEDLVPQWLFPYGELEPIDDCYALNVMDEIATAYYYSAFHLVRIAEGVARTWSVRLPGASHALLAEDRMALIGRYGEDEHRIVHGRLSEGGQFERLGEGRLRFPGGIQPSDQSYSVARGAEFHFFDGLHWLRSVLT